MMNISEILSLIKSKIQEVSGMRVSPLYSDSSQDECCVYSLGGGTPVGKAPGVLTRYSLGIKVSCRRYCDAVDTSEKISSALCSEGNLYPSWDTNGQVLAMCPSGNRPSGNRPSGNAIESEYEHDAEFSQVAREYYLYIRRKS